MLTSLGASPRKHTISDKFILTKLYPYNVTLGMAECLSRLLTTSPMQLINRTELFLAPLFKKGEQTNICNFPGDIWEPWKANFRYKSLRFLYFRFRIKILESKLFKFSKEACTLGHGYLRNNTWLSI